MCVSPRDIWKIGPLEVYLRVWWRRSAKSQQGADAMKAQWAARKEPKEDA